MTADDNATTEHCANADLAVVAATTGEGAVWTDLSLQHLWNARHAAAQCRNREAEVIAAGNHNIDYELRGLAMMAVVSAAGFFESFINGIFLSVNEPQPIQAVEGIAPGAVAAMKNLWNASPSIGRDPALDKYLAALDAVGKRQTMPKGDPICQHVQTALDLRNELLHYKPEWQGSARHHFQSRLNKLPPNRHITSGPWFPNQVLSADCADWTCDVCVAFVDTWSGHMGLTNPPDTRLEKGCPAP
jgi:hypothetical protein